MPKLKDIRRQAISFTGRDCTLGNFSYVDLRDTNLVKTIFDKADLRGSDLRGANLLRARLEKADLRGTDLRGCNLRGVTFRGAKLDEQTHLDKEGQFWYAFYNGQMVNQDLRGVDLSDIQLIDVDLHGADLRQANLAQCYFSDVNLSGADLREANLAQCYFSRVNFSQADLRGTILTPIKDWAKSKLHGTTIDETTQLEQVIYLDWQIVNDPTAHKDFHQVNLRMHDLSKAYLVQADLRQTDLGFALLNEANLQRADLRDAILKRANLCGVNLDQADLTGANLTKAQYDDQTIWPEGFDPVSAGAVHQRDYYDPIEEFRKSR